MSNPHPHTSDSPLRVVVSLDVEEEGLFSGHYATSGCGVSNVSLLPRLAPLSRDLGFPLTLFCAHTVFADAGACRVLEQMRDHYGAEIGAHLHHWSTPPASPLDPPHEGQPTRTDKLPRDLLRQRLATLLDAGREFQGAPLTSFRMGRWDLKDCVRPLLSEAGIKVDSSVCPLRHFPGGPDHFLAPADPYWVEGHGGTRLLEAPVTQIPLLRPLPRLWHGLSPQGSLDSFHFWGALSANPFWHGPRAMRWAVRLHHARGGRVLSLFWHSSEMLPRLPFRMRIRPSSLPWVFSYWHSSSYSCPIFLNRTLNSQGQRLPKAGRKRAWATISKEHCPIGTSSSVSSPFSCMWALR